ncbi:GNAT family N-acetyltransferase [Victivallis sp. Marseille-Q1083]|uniref:GNAT family N-acetyltransferase n=1 Tax=Victivallis sp. Marseille-Q1083 TaxID=2717288 RepID=UPI00158D3D32|nr:GNAT family N-acetyltransferase [Victivallis sp. Marseille-Q1083]
MNRPSGSGVPARSVVRLDESQLTAAVNLVWNVFLEFEAPEYTPEGVANFAKFLDRESLVAKLRAGQLYLLGCFQQRQLLGVIAVRVPAHLCLLFVDKRCHRQGIASRLFQAVLQNCREDGEISRITVNSSPYAVEFYHRLGFVDQAGEQTRDGIRFTPMLLSL